MLNTTTITTPAEEVHAMLDYVMLRLVGIYDNSPEQARAQLEKLPVRPGNDAAPASPGEHVAAALDIAIVAALRQRAAEQE